MLLYLGWILAAFLAGILLNGLWRLRKPTLQQRVARMGMFAGRSYAEILRALGEPQHTQTHDDGSLARTWRSDNYSLTLRFDAQGTCQGVMQETG